MSLVSKDLATVSESKWLVTLDDGEIPARLKTIGVDAERFAILFEVWNDKGYQYTAYKLSDQEDKV